MGHRLSKIYTKTGDTGSTDFGNGARISKSDSVIHLYGELDELNSHLGLILSLLKISPTLDRIDDFFTVFTTTQHLLFDLAGDIIIQERQSLTGTHIKWIEAWLDSFNDNHPPLKNFILPGGTVLSSNIHIARTICRRAERTMVGHSMSLNNFFCDWQVRIKFLNRLSDLLFVLSRECYLNETELWKTPELIFPAKN